MRHSILLLVGLVWCTPAFATDGVLEISQTCAATDTQKGCFPGDQSEFPVTINAPGSYVLTSNLVVVAPDADAIRIETNDVTLDLKGFTIQGPGGGMGHGIYGQNRFNITVRNGRVWGFGGNGVELYTGSGDPSEYRAGHRIEAMHASNNQNVGLLISGGVMVDSTANGNGSSGVVAEASSLSNVTANKNGLNGFNLFLSAADTCVAFGNLQFGFSMAQSSIRGCAAIENGSDGVYVNRSTVTGCRVNNNGNSGIGMGLGTVNGLNHVFRNSASENQGTDQIVCPNNGTDNICVDNASF